MFARLLGQVAKSVDLCADEPTQLTLEYIRNLCSGDEEACTAIGSACSELTLEALYGDQITFMNPETRSPAPYPLEEDVVLESVAAPYFRQ